jgi:hypothetical protein
VVDSTQVPLPISVKRFGSYLIVLTLALLSSQAWAGTQTVQYLCTPAGGHLKANGQPLGAGTFVEVGAFNVGFDPTSANRASWKANWTALQRVTYNAQTQYFDGSADLTSNAAPFTTTNKVWFWIFDLSGNWALYSNTNWTWPNTVGPGGPPLTPFTPDTANIVRAGSVSTSNPEIVCQLVTDAPPPGVTYAVWAGALLPTGAQGKTTDHDGDGQNNLMEYAFGTNPASAGSFSSVVKVKNYSGQNHLAAEIQKYFAVDITYTVQWSDNLSDWFTSGLTTVQNTTARLEVRDANPIGANARRFLRVLVSSPN